MFICFMWFFAFWLLLYFYEIFGLLLIIYHIGIFFSILLLSLWEYVEFCLWLFLFLYLQFGIIYVTYFFGFFMVFKVSIRIWFDFCCDLRVISKARNILVNLVLGRICLYIWCAQFFDFVNLCDFGSFFVGCVPILSPIILINLWGF